MVYDRFKERFFLGERVVLDIHGDKFPAAVRKIHPSRSLTKKRETEAAQVLAATKNTGKDKVKSELPNGLESGSELSQIEGDDSTQLPEVKLETDEIAHIIGTDLNIDLKEAQKQDDPVDDYLYSVQLVSEDNDDDYSMALMERRADSLSRDRASFSKSIVKKFLKERIVRHSSIGSPWIVRPLIAEKYELPRRATNDVAEKNRLIKEGKLSKRRKYLDDAQEDANKSAKKRKASGLSKEEKARLEAEKKEEEERRKEEERKKRMIKYPLEDLQLDPLTEKDIDAMNAKKPDDPPRRKERPTPKTGLLPVDATLFEPLMNSYLFLQACGKALLLSPFTLDDYVSALGHDTHEPACHMVSEVNASLLNVIVRDTSNAKTPVAVDADGDSDEDEFDEERNQSEDEADEDAADNDEEEDELDSKASSDAGSSAHSLDDEDRDDDGEQGKEPQADRGERDELYATARKLGRGWERKQLRADGFRDGWEYSLIGFLSKRATPENFPRASAILSHLTGVKIGDEGATKEENGRLVPEDLQTPVHRYPTLSTGDKILILDFLCEQAVLTRSIKRFFDHCEHALTELRKERVELNRARRKLAEERAAFEEEHRQTKDDEEEGEIEEDAKPKAQTNGKKGKKGKSKVAKKSKGASSKKKAAVDGSGTPAEIGSGDDQDAEEDELESDADASDDEEAPSDEEYDSDANMSNGTGNDSEGKPYRRNFGSRQEAMRVKALQREAEEAEKTKRLAAQREEHKVRMQELRQVTLERKKMDDEEMRIVRREEAIEREFRQHSQAPRLHPMGRDRFLDKYWWFDGVGAASVLNSQGQAQYSTGRLFVQGPSAEEWEALADEYGPGLAELEARRKDEYGGEQDVLGTNTWAVYTEPEEIDALMAWLRAKGTRELQLRQHIQRFRWYLQEGMQKRNHHLVGGWKDNVETRRSNRSKDNAASRPPYMNYRNSFAKGA